MRLPMQNTPAWDDDYRVNRRQFSRKARANRSTSPYSCIHNMTKVAKNKIVLDSLIKNVYRIKLKGDLKGDFHQKNSCSIIDPILPVGLN